MFKQFASVLGPSNQAGGTLLVSPIDVTVTAVGATAIGDLVALPVPTQFSITNQTIGWPATASTATITTANALTTESRRILGVALTATSGATSVTVRIRGVVSAKVDGATDVTAGDFLMGVNAQPHMVKGATTGTQAFFPAIALETFTDTPAALKTVLFDGINGFGLSQEA